MLTVANFNMHCGIDGWGRPFDFVAVCRDVDADVLVLEESWCGDSGGPSQAEQIAQALGYRAESVTLAEGRRALPDPAATAHWMPRFGLFAVHNTLFFESERSLSRAVLRSERYREAEHGSWGIAVLIRHGLDVDDVRVLHLPSLRRDWVRRAALAVDIGLDGHPITIVGTHMSHVHMGSHRHYAGLRSRLRSDARPDAVLLGDMNLWGPAVRALMPSWHRAVKGRTWPSWSPHSQIDHILVRGSIRVTLGEVLPDAGSDHRPVRATLSMARTAGAP